jgi:hypothetical protein
MNIQDDLEGLLGCSVDVLSAAGLSREMNTFVMRQFRYNPER